MAYETPDYEEFYRDQIIFLTGATGGLGGCLLYKLALELPTKKIFVLCRSIPKARETWKLTMPSHIESILKTGKIELVVGDVTKNMFGIASDQLDRIASQTTIVIHSAADISLIAKLPATIRTNCLPSLELAKWASSFPNLISFVQMSTGYWYVYFYVLNSKFCRCWCCAEEASTRFTSSTTPRMWPEQGV